MIVGHPVSELGDRLAVTGESKAFQRLADALVAT